MASQLTWLGHSTFHIATDAGQRILIDPFLGSSPVCPADWHTIDTLDLILCTHGHGDHIADAADTAKRTGATLVGQPELCTYMEAQGVTTTAEMNKGGTQEFGDTKVTMVHAQHSSSITVDGTTVYMGEAAGYIIELAGGETIYHAGDTNVFGDMKLIGELYQPDLALLPIGDHYTMDPREAAMACHLLGVRNVLGMHYGTFPPLTGRPTHLREQLGDSHILVHELSIGQSMEIPQPSTALS